MNPKITIWNLQWCRNNLFRIHVKNLLRTHKPRIFVIIEPRIAVEDYVINRMGKWNFVRTESLGFSGGIWILWRSHTNLQVIHPYHQSLHCQIKDNNIEWGSPAMYANLNEKHRRMLWINLKDFSINIRILWLVAGNSNDITTMDDQFGGACAYVRRPQKLYSKSVLVDS